MTLSYNERAAAEKLFHEVSEWVQSQWPDADIRGLLGSGDEPATLSISLGVANGKVEPPRSPAIRHAHAVKGRNTDVLVHTHRFVETGHVHPIAGLGTMLRSSPVLTSKADLVLADGVPA